MERIFISNHVFPFNPILISRCHPFPQTLWFQRVIDLMVEKTNTCFKKILIFIKILCFHVYFSWFAPFQGRLIKWINAIVMSTVRSISLSNMPSPWAWEPTPGPCICSCLFCTCCIFANMAGDGSSKFSTPSGHLPKEQTGLPFPSL